MIRRPPRSTRTDTLFPYTTLFRSVGGLARHPRLEPAPQIKTADHQPAHKRQQHDELEDVGPHHRSVTPCRAFRGIRVRSCARRSARPRSEEHTSELQSLMRISYAVFCLKKKRQAVQQ